MTLRQFSGYVGVMTLAGLVARFGEPRPGSLLVAGAVAITETFHVLRELDR